MWGLALTCSLARPRTPPIIITIPIWPSDMISLLQMDKNCFGLKLHLLRQDTFLGWFYWLSVGSLMTGICLLKLEKKFRKHNICSYKNICSEEYRYIEKCSRKDTHVKRYFLMVSSVGRGWWLLSGLDRPVKRGHNEPLDHPLLRDHHHHDHHHRHHKDQDYLLMLNLWAESFCADYILSWNFLTLSPLPPSWSTFSVLTSLCEPRMFWSKLSAIVMTIVVEIQTLVASHGLLCILVATQHHHLVAQFVNIKAFAIQDQEDHGGDGFTDDPWS